MFQNSDGLDVSDFVCQLGKAPLLSQFREKEKKQIYVKLYEIYMSISNKRRLTPELVERCLPIARFYSFSLLFKPIQVKVLVKLETNSCSGKIILEDCITHRKFFFCLLDDYVGLHSGVVASQ